MRSMSFMLTTRQFLERSKTVTRRLGWWNVKRGQLVRGVEKARGLRKGEKQVALGTIRILDHRAEALNCMVTDLEYGRAECIKEGFPDMTPEDFIAMFCKANGCDPLTTVSRIEFEYVDSETP